MLKTSIWMVSLGFPLWPLELVLVFGSRPVSPAAQWSVFLFGDASGPGVQQMT